MVLMWFFVILPPFPLFRGQGPGQGRPGSKGVERIATSPGLQPGPPLVHVDPTRIWPDLPGQVEVDPGPEKVGPTHWGHNFLHIYEFTCYFERDRIECRARNFQMSLRPLEKRLREVQGTPRNGLCMTAISFVSSDRQRAYIRTAYLV